MLIGLNLQILSPLRLNNVIIVKLQGHPVSISCVGELANLAVFMFQLNFFIGNEYFCPDVYYIM